VHFRGFHIKHQHICGITIPLSAQGCGTPPTRYLGAKIGKQQLENGSEAWFISAEDYLEKALPVIEATFRPLKAMFKTKLDAPPPASPNFDHELDDTDFLNENDTKLYQSYIGILRWAIELGRIDLAHIGATLAKFMATPRKGHMVAVLRIFACIKKYLKCQIVIDPHERDWSNLSWLSENWKEFYPNVNEEMPINASKPACGNSVQSNMFCDASHATNLMTRRSTTGIIIFLNGTPVTRYSKRQNTIESSTFGSEFIALKIATEMNNGLRYKLPMLGIAIDKPTNTFCDNNSVLLNLTKPDSTLQKKYNSIAYHKVRESVATGSLRVHHKPGATNLADVLTKWLPPHKHFELCCHMLWR